MIAIEFDYYFTAKASSTEIIGSKSTSFFIHIKNAAFRVNFDTKWFSLLHVKKGYHSLTCRTGAICSPFWANEAGKRGARDTQCGERRGLLALFALAFGQLKNAKKITPVQLSNHSPVTIILYCLSLMKNHNCTRVFNTCKTFKRTNVYKFIDQHYHNLLL